MERVVLFARWPRLGRVKTRLVPPLTSRLALSLHRAMLVDSVRRLARLEVAGRELELCLDAALDAPGLPAGVERFASIRRAAQGPGDLGARLARAFRRAYSEGSRATVVLGSDAPTLPLERIEEALGALGRGRDLVLVPARDGGYVLIGLRRPIPRLFREMPWGTERVLERTLERARRLRLELHVARPWYDVDDGASLGRLADELLDRAARGRAPATRRWLVRHASILDHAARTVV